MGAEPISAVIGAGTAIYGAQQARHARKDAKREADAAREQYSQQQATIRREQDRLALEQTSQQKRINEGIARAGRRRVKGGLFGDSEPTPGQLSSTLG